MVSGRKWCAAGVSLLTNDIDNNVNGVILKFVENMKMLSKVRMVDR